MSEYSKMTDLIKTTKQFVAPQDKEKTELCIGEVISVDPLTISFVSSSDANQTIEIGEEQVSLSPLAQTIDVPAEIIETITTDATTCGMGGDRADNVSRLNRVFTLRMHFELEVGDEVVMLRLDDAQHYHVLCKVYYNTWQ